MLGTRTVAAAMAVTAVAGIGLELVTTAAGRAADDRYSIECRLAVVTDEDAIPEPLLGLPGAKAGTGEATTFVAVGTVTKGSVGDTPLDGERFAIFGKGKWELDQPLEVLAVYLDDAAPAEKRRALGSVLMRDPALRSTGGVALSITRIAAASEAADPLTKSRLEIGREGARGVLEITPMKGADGRNPIAVRNGFSRFAETEPIALGVARARFSDHGRTLEVVNGSGEIHHIRLAGSLSPVSEETPPEGVHGGPDH